MHEHRWVVDSIEEHAASVEVDGADMLSLPAWLIPGAARPGDVLAVHHERPERGQRSVLTITVDPAATKKALDASAAQVAQASAGARRKDPGGDIRL